MADYIEVANGSIQLSEGDASEIVTEGGATGLAETVNGGHIAIDTQTHPSHPIITVSDITGFIQHGTNVTMTGTGTTADPYVISSTATGGGGAGGTSIAGTTAKIDVSDGQPEGTQSVTFSDPSTPTGPIYLYAPGEMGIYANVGSDGAGTYAPSIDLQTGAVSINASTDNTGVVTFGATRVKTGLAYSFSSTSDSTAIANALSGDFYYRAADGHLGFTNSNGGQVIPFMGDTTVLNWVSVPASATASGSAGEKAYDGSYLYICTAANTWKRVALASW